MLQGNNSNALGTNVNGLGYQGITKSVAVAIDPNNQISILANGNMSPIATIKAPFNMRDGVQHTMWVDYDSMQKKLNVYLLGAGTQKPQTPVLSANINLASLLGSLIYQGFTSSAGQSTNVSYVDIWGFAVGSSPAVGADRLLQNQQLFPGQFINSPDGKSRLAMQMDGNLVLYQPALAKTLWASNTNGSGVARLQLQTDGNGVLYDITAKAFWATNTVGKNGASLVVQNDSNLILYDATNKAIWATNTAVLPPAPPAVTYYQIKNMWQSTYLFDGGDQLKYGATPGNDFSYQWSLVDRGNGYFEFKNRQTGEYINIEHTLDYIESNNRPIGADSSKWAFEYIDNQVFRLRNGWHTGDYMHIENLKGYVQHGPMYPAWQSARWQLVVVN